MLGFMVNCGFGDTKAPSWFIWDRLSKKTKPVSLRNTDPSVSCAVLFIPSAVGQESFHLSIWLFFSCSILSDFLRFHGLQHAKLPCLSPSPRTCSNSCPLSQWCHPTISSFVIPFSSCLQSFLASGSFPVFTLGSQRIGASASGSVPPVNIQDWFPLGLTGLISLQSKGLSIWGFQLILYLLQIFRVLFYAPFFLDWGEGLMHLCPVLQGEGNTNTMFIGRGPLGSDRPMKWACRCHSYCCCSRGMWCPVAL